MEGDLTKANEIQEKLDELEERAQELDRVRSSNISSISYINQRNRERNVREAEEAAAREQEEAAGAGADPFTRRKCQPTMVTKTTDDAVRQQRRERVEEIYRMDMPEDKRLWKVSVCLLSTDLLIESIEPVFSTLQDTLYLSKKDPKVEAEKTKLTTANDLFDVHNFDVDLDVDVPVGPVVTSGPQVGLGIPRTSGPKRSLNLEDYKRRKGLI